MCDKVFGVECFEVGKRQIVELLGPWANIDCVNDRNRKFGFDLTCTMVLLFVVEGPLPRLYGEVGIVSWISSLQSLAEVLQAELSYDEQCGAKVHYELWHVMDDAELWQEWESDVECTRLNRLYEIHTCDRRCEDCGLIKDYYKRVDCADAHGIQWCDGQCGYCKYGFLPSYVESKADFIEGGFSYECTKWPDSAKCQCEA